MEKESPPGGFLLFLGGSSNESSASTWVFRGSQLVKGGWVSISPS